jgi:hypothetical protein
MQGQLGFFDVDDRLKRLSAAWRASLSNPRGCGRRANAAKSKIRSRIEHVFAEQKDRMGLFIRTIGIARARVKIGMANLVYNFKRLIFVRRGAAV